MSPYTVLPLFPTQVTKECSCHSPISAWHALGKDFRRGVFLLQGKHIVVGSVVSASKTEPWKQLSEHAVFKLQIVKELMLSHFIHKWVNNREVMPLAPKTSNSEMRSPSQWWRIAHVWKSFEKALFTTSLPVAGVVGILTMVLGNANVVEWEEVILALVVVGTHRDMSTSRMSSLSWQADICMTQRLR